MEVRAFQTPPRRLEGEGENNLLSQQPLPSPPALTFRALAPQKLVVHRVLRPLDGLESVFEGGAACEKIESVPVQTRVVFCLCADLFLFLAARDEVEGEDFGDWVERMGAVWGGWSESVDHGAAGWEDERLIEQTNTHAPPWPGPRTPPVRYKVHLYLCVRR